MEEVKKKLGRPAKKIIDYIVVWEIGADIFTKKVIEKINEGYTPLGGAAHGGFTSQGTIVLLQTLTKDK